MSGPLLQIGPAVAAVGAAVALGLAMSARLEGRLPQASGDDVLALVLGDARLEVSRAMEEKADEYFHGGVRVVDCGGLAEHGHEEGAHDDSSAGEDHHDEHAQAPEAAPAGLDPWRWLDSRVHVQVHRHLEGEQAVDLLPWLWGACRMSPKNLNAYLNGAYVLAHMLHKPAEARSLLEEGVRQNPDTPELDFSLAEIALNVQGDAASAERWFASARAKCLPVQASAARAEELLLLRLRSLFYLGFVAKQRGDLGRVQACLEEASSLEPGHRVVEDLRALLKPKESRQP